MQVSDVWGVERTNERYFDVPLGIDQWDWCGSDGLRNGEGRTK